MALKSILINNFKELNEKLETPINYIDLDYNLIEPGTSQGKTHTRTTVLYGNYAVLGAYRLWLQSRKYDYIRSPDFGGMFDNNLNDKFKFSQDSEEAVADYLKEESAKNWPTIEILHIEVKAEMDKRGWFIRIVARDTGSGMILADEVLNPVENTEF